ncbi:MAG: hypothetical protein AAGD08_16000 [Pseudomonadota bacterium]
MGFFKKIGKFFKKVVSSKVFKWIGVAVGAVATIFTAGAALGIGAFAGGWSGAVSSLAGSLGLSGSVGTILTSAVTAAGYGAMTGGAVGLVTNGPEGLLSGAGVGLAGGLVTGGIAGGLQAGGIISSNPFNPSGVGIEPSAAGVPAPGADGLSSAAGKPPVGELAEAGLIEPATAGAEAAGGSGSNGLAGAVSEPITGTNVASGAGASEAGLLGRLGDLANNPIIGNTLSGGARGYLQGMATEDAIDEERRIRDEIRDSYSVSTPTGLHAPRPTDGLPSPVEKYRTRSDTKGARVRRVYDPGSKRVVEVPA